MKSLNLLALSLLAASVTACIAPDGTDGDPGNETPDKITMNSLLPSNLATTSLGLAKLDSTAIANYATSASTRALMTYVFGCAYPSNISMQITSNGNTTTYTGSVGLTGYWNSSPLKAADQQLITACVLARTNYYGDAISISMRNGASSLLNSTQTELTNYFLEEGAFYGNILGGGTGGMHSCMGYDAINNPSEGDLAYRKCTEGGSPTSCNFVSDGACSTVCTTTVTSAGYYDNCNGFTNTVTTFLQ